ncbi:MAG: hypothetical protein KA515_01090 [Candidatus Pacebacteria bacterium]|nr:hypothetical protein [Candidatus Paceibacterota bacterium]
MDAKKLFRELSYLVVGIFVLNFLANKFYWYYAIWYFDVLMHFSGGFWLGLVFGWFMLKIGKVFVLNFDLIWRVALWVLFIGILWELFEFYFINHVAQNPFDLIDTLSDLFFDLFGGTCATIYLWKKQLK